MIQQITAAQLFRMAAYACAQLSAESENVNQLNVFPVPDGDTGSNMSMTMQGVDERAEAAEDISSCAAAIGAGMLRCARGNSGVILSVFFRGLAKGLDGVTVACAADIAHALTEAVQAAYGAVMNPTEGTILTVMRESAHGACQYVEDGGKDMEVLFDVMVRDAHVALQETPELLPMLKKAGVVDAGGYGFEIILRAMRASLLGQEENFSLDEFRRSAKAPKKLSAAAASDAEIVYPYCTECIIEKSEEYHGEGTVEALRQVVLSAGDSAVFVDDAEIVKIHVHTSDPGAVLSAAVKYGSLLTVKIENMRVQHSELSESASATRPIVAGKYSFVSVANGDGICAVLRDLGVDEMVIGGQTMNPSTEQMLQAIDRTDGEYVFVLPNNSNIILVAQQAAAMLQDSGRRVYVMPSKSVPQGISAMYAFDPEASFEDNVEQMREAMAGVCTLSMTQAVRDADVDGLHITKGQVLGLVNNKVEKVSNSLMECLESLMDHLVHASCVTVFCGEGVDHDEASEITALLRGSLQEDTDLTVMDGGQPVYSLIIAGE